MNRILAAVAAALVALAMIVAVWQVDQTPGLVLSDELPTVTPPRPSRQGEPASLVIEEGDTAGTVADRLVEAGVINSGPLFRTLVYLMGLEDNLPAGEYAFQPDTPMLTVIDHIQRGLTVVKRVTVPEGLRLEQIAELMENGDIVPAEDFLAATRRELYELPFLSQLPPGAGLEGYLFPSSYEFDKDVDAQTVVRTMLEAFAENVTPELQAAARRQGLNLHEMVTLASIVEREAQSSKEPPTIAGVYYNRLANGMRLQADPTTQYAVAENPESVREFGWWKQELTIEDLALTSPYNTYASDGLPPGPIASPGLAALKAVAGPAETNYLFFVACGDDGEHLFSATLADHEANVQRCRQQ